MTAWLPDPDAPLVDGCRVRIGDGPHEGTWRSRSVSSLYRGSVDLGGGGHYLNVPLGCLVTVLREVQGERTHDYLSTACHHEAHEKCRLRCKFCLTACGCSCHLVKPDAT